MPGREGGLCGELHAGLDRLERELDALARADGVAASEMAEVLRALTRLVNRAEALRDKGAAIAERAQVPEQVGARSTGQWLADVLCTDPRAALRRARRAAASGVGTPAPEPPGLVAVGAAEDGPEERGAGGGRGTGATTPGPVGRAQLAGDLSPEQVDVIMATLASLRESVAAETRDACERELVALARHRSPRDLRRLAARVLERVGAAEAEVDEHEDAQVATEEDSAWERSSFWIKDNDDGTMTGRFVVPTLAGQTLKKVVDAMSAPRRRSGGGAANGGTVGDGTALADAAGASESGTSDEGADRPQPWFDPKLSWKEQQLARQRRQGQDLAILLGHLPTDHLHDKTAATVLVTTRLSDLQEQTRRAGVTDSGQTLSAGEVRRVACEAGLVPTILGSESQPLDLGRQVRCFTSTQRAALATTYDSCAAAGCDIPFAWTETHHLTPWEAGGRTDLANAVPLCGHHHRLLDRGYDHAVRREGRRAVVSFSRWRT